MALINPGFDRFMLQVVRSLGPYRHDVVLVGGYANALYRYHGHACTTKVPPLLTSDVDLAVPISLPTKGMLLSASLAGAGIRSPTERRSNKYWEKERPNEILELLCPAMGVKRDILAQSPPLVDVQPGSTAEALDYMDLLLAHPWTINLREVPPLNVSEDLPVLIPNPVGYAMQKVLARGKRMKSAKRAKDCCYIYEISVIFRDSLPVLTAEGGKITGAVPAKWCRKYLEDAERLFGHVRAEGIQETMAVGQAYALGTTEDIVFRTMKPMLDAIRKGLCLAA